MSMRLKTIIILLSVAALLALALTFCGGAGSSVMDFEGVVTITRGGKAIPASRGVRLKSEDAVSVGEASSVWLRLDEYKTVSLGELTEVKIISIKKNHVLLLESGVLLARVDKPLKEGESFEVLVGNLTVSVKDTAVFSVQPDAPDNAALNVYHGSVSVYGQDGGELITLGKGKSVRLDTAAGALKGQAEPIDYASLPQIILESVRDYAKEAEAVEASAPILQPDASEIEAETEDEGPDADGPLADSQPEPDGQAEGEPPPDIVPALPDAPDVTFKYMWNGTRFKPYADISWAADEADYIHWQLYDHNGDALTASGRLGGDGGRISLRNQLFDVSPPGNGELYPMGYAIRLTPYYIPSQGAQSLPMPPVVMELPYFEVAAERSGTRTTPVISTNIGFYFNHSHDSLTDSVEGNRIRITGSLVPLEGTKIPIKINVLSE